MDRRCAWHEAQIDEACGTGVELVRMVVTPQSAYCCADCEPELVEFGSEGVCVFSAAIPRTVDLDVLRGQRERRTDKR
eukprot:5581946-Prymnesium_polylepis.2